MVHIVHVSNDFAPLSSGINTHLQNLLPALSTQNFKITLLVPTASDGSPLEIHADANYANVGCIRVSYTENSNPFFKLFALNKAVKKGLEWIDLNLGKPDLIHQHDNRATRIGATHYARKNKIPVVWTNHSSAFFKKSDLSARLLAYVPGIRPDGVVVVHRRLVDRFREFFDGCPVSYIPNGVNTDHFRPGSSHSTKETVILFPQRMIPQKGAIELAKAAGLLIENPDAANLQFWFAGSGWDSNRDSDIIRRVKDLLAPAAAQDRVRFLGNPSYSEMPEFYRKADIVVLPFKMGTESLSVYEAWASGTPVISLRLKETNNYIREGENCILMDSANPNDLADAIQNLAIDFDRRNSLAKHGLEMARNHCTWSHRAEETGRFYRDILNNGKE